MNVATSENETTSTTKPEKPIKTEKESTSKPPPSTLHGNDYQLKITLWILLNAKRIMIESDTKCSVTAEDSLGGKFDDTVLRLHFPDGSEQVLYIQAKHKTKTAYQVSSSDLKAQNGDFSLGKYLQSFRVLHRIGRTAGAQFVLCTNAGVSKDILQVLKKVNYSSTTDIAAIFHRVDADIYQFDKQQFRSIDPFKSFVDDDLTELLDLFLDQFLLISRMKGTLISKDNSKLLGSLNFPSSSLFKQQMGLIEKTFALDHLSSVAWTMSVFSKTKSQADIEQICHKIVRDLCYLQLKGATSIFCQSFENRGMIIKPEILKKSKAYMACMADGLHKHYTKRHAVSNSAIYQLVQLVECEYIFIDHETFLNFEAVLKDIFRALECHLVLVVVCEKDVAAIGKSLEELFKQTVTGFQKTVILITSVEEQIEADEYCVSDLTDHARQEIFEKYSYVKLFGTHVSLENLVVEADNLVLLDGLIQAVEIEKGKTHPSLDSFEKIRAIYINRSWKETDTMDYQNNPLPAGNCNTVNDLAFLLKDLDEPMRFSELVERLRSNLYIRNTSIHDCIIRMDYDYIDYISQYPPVYTLPPGINTNDKVHIFLDEAGFGKTTYMTWLAWFFVVEGTAYWTIRLNAIEYSFDFEQILKDHGTTFDVNDAVRILFQLIHLTLSTSSLIGRSIEETHSQREKSKQWAECLTICEGKVKVTTGKDASIDQQIALRIFREKFNAKQIVLLLDGFDEIAPHYKNVVLNLFTYFAQFEGVHKLYFTSRPYNFIDELKTAFHVTTIYRMKPFTYEDQHEFLHSYLGCYMESYGSCTGMQRMHFFEILLKILRNVLGQLRSIPLFFRMGLDLLTPELEKHVNLKNGTISHSLLQELQSMFGRSRMLEALVNQKLALANLEKSGSSNTASFIVQRRLDAERLNELKKNDLALLSIYTIYPSEYQLLNKQNKKECERLIQDIADGREKSGIVEGVHAGVPLFIHRMFAEYFAACWLLDYRDNHEAKMFFKSKSYWEIGNFTVRSLFDEIAIRDEGGKDSPAHATVMEYDATRLKTELALDNTMHLKTDAIGRTPLHLAVQHIAQPRYQTYDFIRERNYPIELMSLLVEKTECTLINRSLLIDAKDDLLHWSALDYAFRICNQQAIEYLLRKNASINVQALSEQLECDQGASFETLARYDKLVMDYTYDIDNYKPLCVHSAKQIELMGKVCNIAVAQTKNYRTEWFEAHKTNILMKCAETDSVLLYKSLQASETELLSTSLQTIIAKEALKHCSLHVIGYLIHECKIDVSIAIEEEELYNLLVTVLVRKYAKLFTFFLDLYYSKLSSSKRTHWKARGSRIMDLLLHVITYGSFQMVEYFIKSVSIIGDVEFMCSFIKGIAQIQDHFQHHDDRHHQQKLAITLPYVFDRDVNIFGCDDEGRNLLHLSAELGLYALLEYLIEHKQFNAMTVNRRNGWNAYHYCVSLLLVPITRTAVGNHIIKGCPISGGRPEDRCIKSFQYMMKGSTINGIHAVDAEGRNVFHLAVTNSHLKIAKIILVHALSNISSELRSEEQRKYIEKSNLNGRPECTEFLRFLEEKSDE